MPNYNFTLKTDTIAAIVGGGDNARELLARDLLAEEDELYGALWNYCRDDRGEVAYGSISIDPELMGIHKNFTGIIAAEFQEQAYYGCRDLDVQDDRQVEISFSISLGNNTLTLDVPEPLRISDWHAT